MRILHVIPSLAMRHGGPPKAAQELCRELVRVGHEVTIYTTNLDGNQRLDVPVDRPIRGEDGVVRWYFATQRSGLYGVSMSLIRALRRNIRNFDVVHIHTLYRFTSTIAAHYCRREDVPYILRPHGTLDPFLFHRHRLRKRIYEALFETRNLKNAAAVHFTANEEMRLAQSLGLQFRGVVVPLGVDPELTTNRDQLREQFSRDWPATRGKKVILFLSRLNFKKGLDLLAKAFGSVARTRSDVHLFLAGPDDEGYGRKVCQWLGDEGALDRATFAGMLSGERKAAAIAAAELFVLPSYSENFGFAVVEALAAGVPSIISNKVNIWREVSDARAGLVVNCNADELARAISTLLDDADLRCSLSDAGKQLVAEKFTWPTVAAKMIAVYRDVIAKSPNLYSTETSPA
jgi:glycosyltransferase involved in cell wall biosynthesis